MLGNLICLLLGTTTTVFVQLVGKLPIVEALLLGIGPIAIVRNLVAFRGRTIRFFAVAGCLWLCFQALSDLYNGVSPLNTARGLAGIFMTVLGVLTFYALFAESDKRFWWYLVGTVPSAIYSVLSGGSSSDNDLAVLNENVEMWDIAVAPIATPILLLIGAYYARRSPAMVSVVLGIYGLLAVSQQSRSHGLAFLLTGVLYFLASRRMGFRLDLGKIAVMAAPVVVVGFVSYVNLGLKGELGPTTAIQLRSLEQPYNPIYVVFSGRVGFLVALDAISDSPLLGHGSWAFKPEYMKLLAKYSAALKGEPRSPSFAAERGGMIPAHSVILGAWVFGGIVGGLLWLWVGLLLCVRMLPRALKVKQGPQTFYVINFCLTSLWVLLFSPVPAVRGAWGAGFAFAIVCMSRLERSGFGAQVSEPPSMKQH